MGDFLGDTINGNQEGKCIILHKKHYILLFLALACFILFSGNATADSISFNLITTATTNVNAISLYLDNGAIHTAADLAAAIPNCTAVAYWDVATQSYIEHTAGKPFNNFNVTPGHAYFVTVSAPTAWTLTGDLPTDLSFQLQTTDTTDVNAIVIPDVVVYFIPTSEGSKSATLDIESNVSGKSPLSIPLSGTGTPALVLGDVSGDRTVSDGFLGLCVKPV